MPSRKSTIEKARQARELYSQGKSIDEIVKALPVPASSSLVGEYLKRNEHSHACKICGGYGISKDRRTGKTRAICTY